MNNYVTGNTVTITCGITNALTGEVYDPAVVRFEIKPPSGENVTYTYGTDAEVTKVDVGSYRLQFVPLAVGQWKYRMETENNMAAAEGAFNIKASKV